MEENKTQPKTLTEETAKKLTDMLLKLPGATQSIELTKKPVYHIRNNQIITGVIGTIGLVIFALGIENATSNIALLSNPIFQIITGIVLLSVSGLMLKKLS